MFLLRRIIISVGLAFLLSAVVSCQSESNQLQYKKWIVSKPLLTAGAKGSFDNVAVKDPSVVFYNDNYHLFYTGKSSKKTSRGLKYDIDICYVSSQTLEGLNSAKRYNFRDIIGEVIIAPQVFYFEPQKLWYLIAHKNTTSNRDLAPVYLTNPDIENIEGWSKSKILKTAKTDDEFWIDFWVICDEKNAHFFYSNQKGSVLRMQCPIDTFPQGLEDSKEKVALTLKGEDDTGEWIMFEAEHIYHVKDPDKYLILLECGYTTTQKRCELSDSRRRFLTAMVADKLEGPWTRVEQSENEYFAHASTLYQKNGDKSKYTQVSHPELIRSGYNQELEIDDFNIDMLFQSFDGSETPDNYQYSGLPWEFVLGVNYR